MTLLERSGIVRPAATLQASARNWRYNFRMARKGSTGPTALRYRGPEPDLVEAKQPSAPVWREVVAARADDHALA
jgi:hypothetical protein